MDRIRRTGHADKTLLNRQGKTVRDIENDWKEQQFRENVEKQKQITENRERKK